jgi:hypothetical protein
LHVQIRDWKGQFELAMIQWSKPTQALLIKMHNTLKEFEELMDNTLFKVWGIRIPNGNNGGKQCKNS